MKSSIIQQDLETIIDSNLPWSQFEGKTVLISGANGFLPAYMVETLLFLNQWKKPLEKVQVIGLVRNKNKALFRFSNYLNRPDLQLIVQDVCQSVNIDEKLIILSMLRVKLALNITVKIQWEH